MKYFLLIFFLPLLGTHLMSQADLSPISVGYFGNLGYQPGLKIGTQFDLRSWSKDSDDLTIRKSFYISPQVGFYVDPNVHTGYVITTDFGFKRVKGNEFKYYAFSLGTGLLIQSQITELKVNLSDGSKENTREHWAWFLSTLNIEFGNSITNNLGWYAKLSGGYKMAPSRGDAIVLFAEFGARFNLFSKK